MGVRPTVVNAHRIGKKRDPGPNVQPRLLKLTLASDQDKVLLLHTCTKLRNKNNSEDIGKVYVSPDLTPWEQQRSLRSQLAEMNREGKKYWIKKRIDSTKGGLSFTLTTHNALSSGHDNLFVTCMLTNAKSIMNKLAELQIILIDQYRPLIIGITEM